MKNTDIDGLLARLKRRDVNAHKGDFGKVLLLCGSRGYTGAAALAAMGALRVGAGLVYLGVPACIYTIEAVKLTESIVFGLPDHDGMLSDQAVDTIGQMLPDMDAVLVGPGLGRSHGTNAVLRCVLEDFDGPVVLDADGINSLSAHKDILRDRTGATLITPHEGEFARFMGRAVADRMSDAVSAAKEYGICVLLKGHETVVTDGEHMYVNPTGNPGMAVGGSGDLLAGMITGLLGQGLGIFDAAACGAWLHGAAGDICAAELGQCAMLPSDMLNVLPRLLK